MMVNLFQNLFGKFKEYNLWKKNWPLDEKDEFSIENVLKFIKSNFDAVLITGSVSSCMDEEIPWNKNLRSLVMELIQNDVPLLGFIIF
jgi:GMP synthase-like glutamine amidotransferase